MLVYSYQIKQKFNGSLKSNDIYSSMTFHETAFTSSNFSYKNVEYDFLFFASEDVNSDSSNVMTRTSVINL